jgi:conjugal transfer pilus assembly protein TraB
MNLSDLFKKLASFIKAKKGGSSSEGFQGNDFEDGFLKSSDENEESSGDTALNNNVLKTKQHLLLSLVLIGILVATCMAILFLQTKTTKKKKIDKPVDLKIELADKALNPEVHWRNYYEDQREQDKKDFEDRLKQLEDQQTEVLNSTKKKVEEDLADTKEKLLMAQKELETAGVALQRVASEEEARINSAPPHLEPSMNEINYATEVEFDEPKSNKNYIPEGTYFNGYLLGGIVVSTALNTADENATPVSIRLKTRGNLSAENTLDISKCRIMGSAYGDLSSERAVIRLEKMVCETDGMYVTSKLAGIVYGPDGFNGIKGSVVSTSTKHLKNAMVGGMISGLSSIAKGQEGMNVSSAGVLSTKSHSFKDLATGGIAGGVSNVGDKLADYYLKQAESMSPVLIIPAGVRIQAHIIKGFSVGEVGTIGKIKAERNKSN